MSGVGLLFEDASAGKPIMDILPIGAKVSSVIQRAR